MPAALPSTKPGSVGRAPGDAARGRIVAGARSHFFAHGFRGVTMDDLAAELGMSKKTLYAHFHSKLALLQAVMDEKMSAVEADLERASTEGADDFPSRLQALLSCMRFHTEEIGAAYVRDVRREAPELFTQVQIRRRELIQRFFGKLLEDGRGAGMIRKDIPATMMIEMLLGAVDAVVNPGKMGELDSTPKVAFNQIITIFLEGVLTNDGRTK
ncbi:MAG: TetR/AcrR family transcriptional regulator [Chthoniobacter sp.]|uniref:TetR/AcrR family transcriptional regulator n=1 Tax=Chthoniobacter sp. TaxID=2510640 RepID=UPI0032A58A68